jgi:7-cyano-7-deazaguanine reductase
MISDAAMTTYFDTYNPKLLFPVARAATREILISQTITAFEGTDTWNCFEVTWLGENNYPEEATLQVTYPASSPFLIESKSLKLYLMSFSMMQFKSIDDLIVVIRTDLAKALQCPAEQFEIARLSQSQLANIQQPRGFDLDSSRPSIASFTPSPSVLKPQDNEARVTGYYYSNCLRSLCPLTGQPDFGTVEIFFDGFEPDLASLARYIVSLRNHGGYHEHCCEMVFADIMTQLTPIELAVRCTYTRRGGIDISPVRYTKGASDKLPYQRLPRC